MVWRALCDFHPSPLAAAATRRWQQTPKFGTWARGLGFSTTDFGTTRPAVSHMFSPATNGAHAKPGNSHLCANAQRPCRSFGHGLPRRAHNLQRWQKTRLCSSLHSSAVTLRYGAHRGNDSIAEDLTRQIADVMRIHDIVRPGDRCEQSRLLPDSLSRASCADSYSSTSSISTFPTPFQQLQSCDLCQRRFGLGLVIARPRRLERRMGFRASRVAL